MANRKRPLARSRRGVLWLAGAVHAALIDLEHRHHWISRTSADEIRRALGRTVLKTMGETGACSARRGIELERSSAGPEQLSLRLSGCRMRIRFEVKDIGANTPAPENRDDGLLVLVLVLKLRRGRGVDRLAEACWEAEDAELLEDLSPRSHRVEMPVIPLNGERLDYRSYCRVIVLVPRGISLEAIEDEAPSAAPARLHRDASIDVRSARISEHAIATVDARHSPPETAPSDDSSIRFSLLELT